MTNCASYQPIPRKDTYFYSTKSLEFEIEKFGRNRRKTSFSSLIYCNSCPDYPPCHVKREVVYGNVAGLQLLAHTYTYGERQEIYQHTHIQTDSHPHGLLIFDTKGLLFLKRRQHTQQKGISQKNALHMSAG